MDEFVLTSPGSSRKMALKPGLNQVGRNPTNNVRIHDASVSSFHCEITVTSEGVWVKDLQSTNGTCVEGEPVQEALIQPGQQLRLGAVELQLERQECVIAIPEKFREKELAPQSLPDGSPACSNHPERAADYRCGKCSLAWCEECVRLIGRKGGSNLVFCRHCDGGCEALPSSNAESEAQKKESVLGRITQTIKMRFK